MTDVELLAEWIEDLRKDVRRVIEELPPEALDWQPDAEANSIGLTVWHVSRWLDLLAVRVFQNRAQSEEQWFTRGWAEKYQYDPSGLGLAGLGALTGYTLDQARAVPPIRGADLIVYLEQVVSTLAALLRALPEGSLHELAPGLQEIRPGRTRYDWVKPVLQGILGHLGEIVAIRAMYQRTSARQSQR